MLTKSLAICEYLDEILPDLPLLPEDPLERANVCAAAQLIACEVHPLQNLKVLDMLRARGLDEKGVTDRAREVIETGLEAFSATIAANEGPYCFGAQVTQADICLVPQLGNARRFGARFDFPRILEVEAACNALPAFQVAVASRQPDAE